MTDPDPRLTPARPDIAAEFLRGKVAAGRFVEGTAAHVIRPCLPVTSRPDPEAGYMTELLRGEAFTVYDEDMTSGYSWGQAGRDGYVGYVPGAGLAAGAPETTHHVSVMATHLYPAPDIKTAPMASLPFLSRVRVSGQEGRFLELAEGGFVPGRHLREGAPEERDWVEVAERFLGRPYLWGGSSPFGIDCSGLIQIALMASGRDCPRDSDMQETALGAPLEPGSALRRGDIPFWPVHLGVMVDDTRLLHANAFHMAVAIEPLELVADRIRAAEGTEITSIRRL